METFGSAAILAGGEGRRMRGLDKLAIELGGERVAARIVGSLGRRFDDILVITSRPEAFAGLGVRTIGDTVPGRGPLGGLHAALAASRSEWLYMTACDMPWQSLEWIDLLEARIEARRAGSCMAAFARTGSHLEPFSAFYRRAAAGLVGSAISDCPEGGAPSIQTLFRGTAFIGVSEEDRAHLDGADRLFTSLNTPEELAKAREELDRPAKKSF